MPIFVLAIELGQINIVPLPFLTYIRLFLARQNRRGAAIAFILDHFFLNIGQQWNLNLNGPRTNHIIQYAINTVAGNTERNINYKCNA